MALETAAYRGDWDQFRSSLTEDVRFAVGSVSEVTGPQAVADYSRKTQTGDHQPNGADIRGSWERDNGVIIGMVVHARRAGDGKTVSDPSVGTFRFRGDKVSEWRTYPVYPSFISSRTIAGSDRRSNHRAGTSDNPHPEDQGDSHGRESSDDQA